MEGVSTDLDVVSLLTNIFGEVLVDSNTASLKSLRGDLLLLVTYQVSYEGEGINRSLLVTYIVDLDLGVRYTTAVAGLDVWLVLLVTVAAGWTSSHLE